MSFLDLAAEQGLDLDPIWLERLEDLERKRQADEAAAARSAEVSFDSELWDDRLVVETQPVAGYDPAAAAAAQAFAAAVPSLALGSRAAPRPPPPPPPPRRPAQAAPQTTSAVLAAAQAYAVAQAQQQQLALVRPGFGGLLPPSTSITTSVTSRGRSVRTPSRRGRAVVLSDRAAATALVAASSSSGRSAVWRPPPVRPLPLTHGTGWQVDFGVIPSRVPTLPRPAPEKRAKFVSYGHQQGVTFGDFAGIAADMHKLSPHTDAHRAAFLNYTARGNVRPEQHTLESCYYSGSGGVSSSVTTSYTPYSHGHEVNPNDLGALPPFAATDPDNQDAPKTMVLRLLPTPDGPDGHTHHVQLTLEQAKTIMSGRPLTTSSSEPEESTVPTHVHMVTIGC